MVTMTLGLLYLENNDEVGLVISWKRRCGWPRHILEMVTTTLGSSYLENGDKDVELVVC